ncbi:uncharacterized protein BJ171DRAFT_595533, partial [Polychytrium aggregatum]|uniref:uncharacterized protein n=1 Tax=Polychytrium aggregatum TaxID=110093 RepID=UPI0022FEB27F
MRTIILVGKTGLGKTTFANYLAGSQLQTGSGVTSVTANPQPIVFKHNGVQHRVVDMPGFSDVRINSKEAITDEVIHRWILQEVVNNEVVGIVMFLSQEDVLGARLSKEFVAISEIMMTRFSGFESMCFFAISGKNMIGGMGDFIKAAMTVVTTGKLRIMGLGPDNWARCKKKDFARVKDWCLKRLQASEPRLVPRTTVDLCKRCGLRADPLLIDGPCRYHHESGELVH